MRLARTLVYISSVLGACSAAAGTVSVNFVNPANYVDAGDSSWDEEANLKLLAGHLQTLAQRYLPADQTLKVDVLDVDLAGSVNYTRAGAFAVRRMRGRTDWPRITLRYTLESGGRPLRTGEEAVTDMTYTQGIGRYRAASEALFYERHMLEGWFRARFAEDRVASH